MTIKKQWKGGMITPKILEDWYDDPEFQKKVIGGLKEMLEEIRGKNEEK